MAGTDKVQEEIIEEFSAFDEWLDRYEVLIGLGNELPAIAPAHRDELQEYERCFGRDDALLPGSDDGCTDYRSRRYCTCIYRTA